MREIVVAKNAGFCFGVARATTAVEKEIAACPRGERIYTLGRLIHNETYNQRLATQGVSVISTEDVERLARESTAESPGKVFVRAHGMTVETDALLQKCAAEYPHFSYVDCTCSYVKKIHKIASEQSEISRRAAEGESGEDEKERIFLVLGSDVHPEVVGFFSRFEGEKYVSLAYKYEKADKEYTLVILNEPVCVVEYQQDGSSTNMFRQYLRNPKGFAFVRKESMKESNDLKDIFRNCIHYVSSSIISRNGRFIQESPKKLMTVLAIPFGVALRVYIKHKSKGFMKVEGFSEK